VDQPQDQQPSSTSDGPGASKNDVALANFEKNRAVTDRQAAIVASARAKLKAEMRATSTAPAPVSPQANNAPAPGSPEATKPDPNALAAAFTAQLDAKSNAAQQAMAQAEQIKAEAGKRAQTAEAKLQHFLQNPVAYLEDQKLDADAWQARLLNGGVQTPEEQARAELRKEFQATVAPLQHELQSMKQAEFNRAEQAALVEARTILAEHFPLVHHFVTPEGYIAELKRQVAANGGKPVDAQKVAETLEAGWLAKTQGALQNPKAAAKVSPGTTKSPLAPVAAQATSTMTNRTTSTVSGQQTRAKSDAERIARGREQIKQLAAEKRI
jgi:hypothetical protein